MGGGLSYQVPLDVCDSIYGFWNPADLKLPLFESALRHFVSILPELAGCQENRE